MGDFVERLWRLAGAAFLLSLLSSCDLFDAKIVIVCESALKDRLRSPSEYKRIEITRSEEAIGRAEYKDLFGSTGSPTLQAVTMADFDSGAVKPVRYTLRISYDAPNAYGTPIRGVSRCEYASAFGGDSTASEFTVRIDGDTDMEWRKKQH